MLRRLAALACATLVAAPAAAINKCYDSNGKVTYSDLPCPETTRKTEAVSGVPRISLQDQLQANRNRSRDVGDARRIEMREDMERAARDRERRKADNDATREQDARRDAERRAKYNQALTKWTQDGGYETGAPPVMESANKRPVATVRGATR